MFPTNQNFLSANAGLSGGNNVCFPMYLAAAPTTTTVNAPYGVAKIGQVAIVPGTGAWILLAISVTAGVYNATWVQYTSASGDVLSVTGTANQILATPTTGNVILSLIGPYTPATYTAHGVLIGEGTSSIVATSAGTAGQLLTSGGASADPTWTTATFPLTATAGSLIAATTTNVIGQIADVAVGQILASGGVGVIPAYTATPSVTSVTTTTGLTATTAGAGITLNANTASGAASGAVVLNSRAGRVVFTSVSIAAAADLTLTMTNSSITSSSTQVITSIDGATTGSALSMKSKTPGSGTIAFVITNGTGATTTTADIGINFLVVN